MQDRMSMSSSRPTAGPVLAAMALGAWMLAWGWAAEAHEPSRVGGAPSAIAVSVLATPSFGIDVMASPAVAVAPLSLDATGPAMAAAEPTVVRRPWNRGLPPQPAPVAPVYRKPPKPVGWVTLRSGFFDGDYVPKDDFLAGFKMTGRVGDALQMGISTDWQYHSETGVEWVGQYIGPGGVPVGVTTTRYESSSHLIPILGVVELRPDFGGVQPYIGAGVGYEVLVVEVRDYYYGVEYEDDYGGFGWQPYGGLGVTLGRNLQFVAEGYWNFSTVERTVRDLETGYLVEQRLDVDGAGLRFGLAFGF